MEYNTVYNQLVIAPRYVGSTKAGLGPISLYVTYKLIPDEANNQTKIDLGMYVDIGNTGFSSGIDWSDIYGSYLGTKTDSFTKGVSGIGEKNIIDITSTNKKTLTVKHNSDGAASATIYWKWGVWTSYSYSSTTYNSSGQDGAYHNPSGSFTITLPSYSRQSSFELDKTSVNVGDTITATITPSKSTYTHTVRFYYNDSYSTTYTDQSTSTSFTIPDTWYECAPSSSSFTAYCDVTTYDGDKEIGVSAKKNFTVNIPSSIKPTISSDGASLTGSNLWNGIYIQGESSATITINSSLISAGEGSSISYYLISGDDGTSVKILESDTDKKYETGVLNDVKTISYTLTAYDTRNRSSNIYDIGSITIHQYGSPTISCSATRAVGSDTTATITYQTSCYSLNNQNKIESITLYYKKTSSDDNYTTISLSITSAQSISNTYSLSNLSGQYGYDIKMVSEDSYGSTSDEFKCSIPTTSRPFNMYQNSSIAIGGMADVSSTNKLDVYWGSEFRNNVTFDNSSLFNGLLQQNVIISPYSTFDAHTISGTYFIDKTKVITGGPSDTLSGWLIVRNYSGNSNYIYQVYLTINGVQYHRFKNSTTFSNWYLDTPSDICITQGYDSTTGFYYRKFSSGIMEMWGDKIFSSKIDILNTSKSGASVTTYKYQNAKQTYTHGTITETNNWFSVPIPYLFSSRPIINISSNYGTWAAIRTNGCYTGSTYSTTVNDVASTTVTVDSSFPHVQFYIEDAIPQLTAVELLVDIHIIGLYTTSIDSEAIAGELPADGTTTQY